MAVEMRIPALLKSLVGGATSVTGEGQSVAQLMDDLELRYPGIRERVLNQDGSLKQFVNIFVNDEDIRFLQGLATPVSEGDVVSILPAIAGG